MYKQLMSRVILKRDDSGMRGKSGAWSSKAFVSGCSCCWWTGPPPPPPPPHHDHDHPPYHDHHDQVRSFKTFVFLCSSSPSSSQLLRSQVVIPRWFEGCCEAGLSSTKLIFRSRLRGASENGCFSVICIIVFIITIIFWSHWRGASENGWGILKNIKLQN